MSRVVWNGEMRAGLANLWSQGRPASEIATRLSVIAGAEVTKNAVIGQAHRLGLARQSNPIKRSYTKARRTSPKLKAARPVVAPADAAPATVFKPRAPSAEGCNFIVSGSGRHAVRCDDPVERGSYCAVHRVLCSYTAPTRAAKLDSYA